MSQALIVTHPPRHVPAFDEVVARFADRETSFTEVEALKQSHWDMGEDGRLREDARFRQTPWDRWMLAQSLLANDALYADFARGLHAEVSLTAALAALTAVTHHTCVFCPADERFVLDHGRPRLSARELTTRPFLEDDVTDLEKYVTHLPVHSLRAAAASEPAGEWGPGAQKQAIETLGWVRVHLQGRGSLNDRMFVAQIEGHSMDDGRSGLVVGGFAVFELWPPGSKQNLNLLVRGSFADPDTGSYAVKKYVGDIRDAEGRHHRITLVSLNPDKARYPDIELEVAHEGDITVVARVVQPLGPDEYVRQPRPPRRPGRRNLTDPDEQAKRAERMRQFAKHFFEAARPSGAATDEETDTVDWQARLVCLDAESGGLCIETRPLSLLPPFAKKLSVVTGTHPAIVLLASNLRTRLFRTPVPPSVEPYRWSAPGHEEMLDDDLAALQVPGLAKDEPTLFRVDAAGIGQPLVGSGVSAGSAYRLVIPPARVLAQPPVGELHDLGDGWQLWEFAVPSTPGLELRDTLQHLGLELGKAAPSVRWVLRSPVAYEQAPRGEAYPVFSRTESPVVAIDGIRCTRPGELMLFLLGDARLVPLRLAPGDLWITEIKELGPGRYVLQVVHERTRFEPVTLPFVVAADAAPVQHARMCVRRAEEDIAPAADGTFGIEADFSAAELLNGIAIKAPPLWPFEVWWDDGRRRHLSRISASADGLLDLELLAGQLADLLRRCILASLVLDAAELGRIELRHTRRSTAAEIRARLQALMNERCTTMTTLDGQFLLLRNMWIHPVLELLGYAWQDVDADQLAGAPAGTTGLRLLEASRSIDGRIRSETFRALVLVTSSCDLQASDMFSARHFADRLCQQWGVREALLTDGMRWARHQRGSHLPLKLQRIDEALSADLFSFHDFLRELANPGAVEG
jgi:hypothetical protein